MSEAVYYTRVRGKISGPYGVDALRRMVRMGLLSRIHEISSDRNSWARAGDYEDLFPSAPSRTRSKAQDESILTPVESLHIPPVQPPPAPQGGDYFPGGSGAAWQAPRAPAAAQPPENRHWRGAAGGGVMATVVGLLAGGILLLCMLPPWFSIADQTVWSWSCYRVPGAGAWPLLVTYLILAGAALGVVSPLTTGVARGIIFVGVAAGALLLFLAAVLGLDTPRGDSGSAIVIFYVLFYASLAAIAGVCQARAADADSAASRIVLGSFSSLALVGLIACFIISVSQTTTLPGVRSTPPTIGSLSHLPASFVFGVVLMLAGAAAGLTAPILGFIGLSREFSRGLNRATSIAAVAGIVLPLLGTFVIFLSLMDLLDQRGPSTEAFSGTPLGTLESQVTLVIIRLIAIWCAVLAILAMGISENLIGIASAAEKPERSY